MRGGAGAKFATRLFCCCLAAALSLFLQTPRALAQDMEGFRSPSGNVQCLFFDETSVRCHIGDKTTPLPLRPQDCELDWGNDYGLDETSRRGELLCVGDTIVGRYLVLPYGESFRRGAITCRSEQLGVTCTNARGAGFALSRGRQLLF